MDWKDKLNEVKKIVPIAEETPVPATPKPQKKRQSEPLRVELDKRNGKPATLITEFQGKDDELKELAKLLKVKCGAGGSSRDGEILVQGDFRVKIVDMLLEMGFKVKKINFK
jgi:translation initiation factor 1